MNIADADWHLKGQKCCQLCQKERKGRYLAIKVKNWKIPVVSWGQDKSRLISSYISIRLWRAWVQVVGCQWPVCQWRTQVCLCVQTGGESSAPIMLQYHCPGSHCCFVHKLQTVCALHNVHIVQYLLLLTEKAGTYLQSSLVWHHLTYINPSLFARKQNSFKL